MGNGPRSNEAETRIEARKLALTRVRDDKITRPSPFTALLGLMPKGPFHD